MTPHINAKKNEIAKTVLIPGDPKRTEYMAKKFLENPVLVNDIRKEVIYTGTYKGKKVSIASSGMGMPSMGIYAYELFNFYDVENIIRIGSCKSFDEDVHLSDLILVKESYTHSNYSTAFAGEMCHVALPSKELNDKIKHTATNLGINIFSGRVMTTDIFYSMIDRKPDPNTMGLEMETFALLYIAEKLNKNGAALLTVSDSSFTDEKLTSEEREKSFKNAIELVLESVK